MTLNFITFGGGHVNYRRAARRLGRQAFESDFFDKVFTYNEFTLQNEFPAFWINHQNFITSNPRGFGKWLWKPFLIRELLKNLDEGDGVCYFDSGCQLNLSNTLSRQRFQEYLEFTTQNHLFAGQLNPIAGIYENVSEETWTRDSVLSLFDLSPEKRSSNQIQATFVFLIKSSTTSSFIEEWFLNCYENDYFCLSDGFDEEQSRNFIEHRFDQSVFSCLYKKHGFEIFPDESMWAPNWQKAGADYPIWAMRNRTGKNPFGMDLNSIIDEIYPKTKLTLNLANKFLS